MKQYFADLNNSNNLNYINLHMVNPKFESIYYVDLCQIGACFNGDNVFILDKA